MLQSKVKPRSGADTMRFVSLNVIFFQVDSDPLTDEKVFWSPQEIGEVGGIATAKRGACSSKIRNHWDIGITANGATAFGIGPKAHAQSWTMSIPPLRIRTSVTRDIKKKLTVDVQTRYSYRMARTVTVKVVIQAAAMATAHPKPSESAAAQW